MKLLKDTRVSLKIMAVVIMLGALTLGLSIKSTMQLSESDRSYALLVEERLPATTELVRMSRNMTQVAYAAYQIGRAHV